MKVQIISKYRTQTRSEIQRTSIKKTFLCVSNIFMIKHERRAYFSFSSEHTWSPTKNALLCARKARGGDHVPLSGVPKVLAIDYNRDRRTPGQKRPASRCFIHNDRRNNRCTIQHTAVVNWAMYIGNGTEARATHVRATRRATVPRFKPHNT